MITDTTKEKLQLRLFLQHEKMAEHYACRVFNYEKYGYEREDIVQELKIKLYNCINTYINKLIEYKRTGRYKPIPLEYYLKTAMINKSKDFISLLNRQSTESSSKVNFDSEGYDEGRHCTMDCEMDLDDCVCEINGVDLFYKLKGLKRKIFSLYLKGFPIKKLKAMFPVIKSFSFIKDQIEYLTHRKKDLLNYQTFEFKVFEHQEA